MAHLISHGSSLAPSEQVADWAGPSQDIDFDYIRDAPFPARPSSRLGFNAPALSTCSSDAPSGADADILWSCSSAKSSVTIDDPEVQALRLSECDMEPAAPICAPASEINDPKIPVAPLPDGATAASVAETPHDQHQCARSSSAPAAPRKSPSVSRLSFPFVTTNSPRRNKAKTSTSPPPPPPSPPPPRHKYSCFPSRMSPTPAGRPFPRHPRHGYNHHGYSRTALQNVKWFWAARAETQDGANALNVKAYDGIIQDCPRAPSAPQPPVTTATLAPEGSANPESVYPRRGDIRALRDPHCAHVDRCFAGLPAWTISKTLWMHDMHIATQVRADAGRIASAGDSSDEEDEDEDEEHERGLLSTNFSDDSDATLVESESETDASDVSTFGHDTDMDTDADTDTDTEVSNDAKAKTRRKTMVNANYTLDGLHREGKVLSSHDVYANHHPASKRFGISKGKGKTTWSGATNRTALGRMIRDRPVPKHQWATDWTRRWEVLMYLVRKDDRHTLDMDGVLKHILPPTRPLSGLHPARMADLRDEDEDDLWTSRLEWALS